MKKGECGRSTMYSCVKTMRPFETALSWRRDKGERYLVSIFVNVTVYPITTIIF
jgi:hypothetical protein